MKRKKVNEVDINYVVDAIIGLYEFFENYIWTKNDKDLNIKINNQKEEDSYIFTISLNKKDHSITNFILNFDLEERKMYEYISIFFMFGIFKNVVVHSDNNKIYNNSHKPYLEYTVEDKILLDKMKLIISKMKVRDLECVYNYLKDYYLNMKPESRVVNGESSVSIANSLVLSRKIVNGGYNE